MLALVTGGQLGRPPHPVRAVNLGVVLQEQAHDRLKAIEGGPEQRRAPVAVRAVRKAAVSAQDTGLSLIHIPEPTRPERISYAVFCLKKKIPIFSLVLYSSRSQKTYMLLLLPLLLHQLLLAE